MPRGKLFGLIDLANEMTMYVVVLVIFLAGFLFIYRIINSPFGEVLKAIRENETRAISLGYKTDRYKLVAFVLSATLAGVAGATKAIVLQIASLTDVNWPMSGEVVLMTLVGGLGTVFGPVVGAFVIIAMQNYLAPVGAVGDGDPGRDLRRLRAAVPPRHHRRDRQLAAHQTLERDPFRLNHCASLTFCLRMILSENRFPSRIKSGTGFFGVMRVKPPSASPPAPAGTCR